MAPRKGKIQGKRNIGKIKSKPTTQKRGLKPFKKAKPGEKPLDDLKWLNKMSLNKSAKQCETDLTWAPGRVYKQGISRSSMGNRSDYANRPVKDAEEKSTSSDGSGECNCSFSRYFDNKNGILKHGSSSTNSIVAKYIQSGIDHVASFIVESAIRFGEQHGVVVPDKNCPNVYEITPPDNLEDKCRKIRFKLPERVSEYENDGEDDIRRSLWRSQVKGSASRWAQSPVRDDWKVRNSSSSWESTADSLDEILPLLEKLKEGGGIVNSDLDLDQLRKKNKTNKHIRKKDRARDKFMTLGKRYKSVGAMSIRNSEDAKYSPTSPWKKFRRDSVDLGRQRLRASTCPRKQQSLSPSY